MSLFMFIIVTFDHALCRPQVNVDEVVSVPKMTVKKVPLQWNI